MMKTKRSFKRVMSLFLCIVLFATLLPTFAFAANLATPNLKSAKATAEGIKVKWDAVSGAEKYRVFRLKSGSWVKLADVTGTSYTDKNVKDGTSYTYTVRCVNASGDKYVSGYNKTGITGTWSKNVLDAPQLVSAKSASGGVTVKWVTVEGISKYRIYRKTGSGAWKQIADVSGNSYKDKSVKTGTTYTYTVRCLNSSGNVCSKYDSTGKTVTYTAYATPVLISAEAGTNGITVKWKAVSGAPMYQVWRKYGSNPWAKLAKTTGTSYVDKTVNAGVEYTYTVRVCNSDGKMLSDYDHTGVKASFAGKAAVDTLTAAVNGVKLEWKAVLGVTKYRVYRKSGSGSWTKLADVSGLTYTDTTAVSGTTYTYTIRGMDSGNKWVGAYDTVGKTITYYAPPHLISAIREDAGIRVKWDSVDGISQYRVFRKINSGKWEAQADVSTTSYLDTKVANNVDATYTVRCLKGGKLVSNYDHTGVTAKSTTFNETPLLTGAVPVANGIKITWQEVDGVTTYQLFRHDTSHTSETWEKYKLVTGTEYIDTGVKQGGKYSYTVACVDSSNEVSSEYNETGLSCTFYKAPVMISAKNSCDGTSSSYVEVTWKAVDGVGTYNVYRKTGAGSWTKIGTSTSTTYKDKSAKSTYHYWYTVACVVGGAEASAYDETGVDTTYYAAPTINGVTSTSSGVKFSWNSVDGINTYNVWRKDYTGGKWGAWTKIATDVSGTEYLDTSVTGGKHRYAVRCSKSGTDVSGYYDDQVKNYISFLPAPTLISATGGSGQIHVKWQAVSGDTYYYQVYRKNDLNPSWKAIGSPTTNTSYTDKDVNKGQNNTYTVRVCDKNGNPLSDYDHTGVTAAAN